MKTALAVTFASLFAINAHAMRQDCEARTRFAVASAVMDVQSVEEAATVKISANDLANVILTNEKMTSVKGHSLIYSVDVASDSPHTFHERLVGHIVLVADRGACFIKKIVLR